MHRNRWFTLIKNLPAPLAARYAAHILAADLLVTAASARHGRLGVLLRARAEVVRRLPQFMKKRRAIQSRRRVSLDYIDSIVSTNWLSFRREEKRRESAFVASKK